MTFAAGTAWAALAAVAWVAPIAAAQIRPSAVPVVVVEDWREQPLGRAGIPLGWEGRSWGRAAYDLSIETRAPGDPRKVLHLLSERDNSIISKRIAPVDARVHQVLEWEWRAVTLPAGADSRRAATDDQVGQVYVVFPRFPAAARSRIIGYVWDTTAPAGEMFRSPGSAMVTYVIVRSGPADLGRWIVERRNVLEDFKRIYGEEPGEPVEAVTLGIDSNDTGTRAEAYVGAIRFRTPDARD